MPKKKTNIYDMELANGSVKARSIVPYADFCAAVDAIVDGAFEKGFSPAHLSYRYYSMLFVLFTDYQAANAEVDEVMGKVYVDGLDRDLYDISPMAVAFRDAVKDAVDYQKNRSPLDTFIEKLNRLDITKIKDVLNNFSSAQITKDDLTKAIVEAVKR